MTREELVLGAARCRIIIQNTGTQQSTISCTDWGEAFITPRAHVLIRGERETGGYESQWVPRSPHTRRLPHLWIETFCAVISRLTPACPALLPSAAVCRLAQELWAVSCEAALVAGDCLGTGSLCVRELHPRLRAFCT
jgi:hypothetical protein